MRNPENIRNLEALSIDWMGMIFYRKSKRHVVNPVPKENMSIKRIGVFVDGAEDYISGKIKMHQLDGVQMHGYESPDDCARWKDKNYITIKAFSINSAFDFSTIERYVSTCDYFLFDTKGKTKGGTGIRFDWTLLDKYHGPTPFLLSGGIGPEHIEDIRSFHHQFMYGIDINSQFETEPAVKNIEAIKKFKDELFS